MNVSPIDLHYLFSIVIVGLPFIASFLLIIFVPMLLKKQHQAMCKFDKSLKNQENLLRRFDLMLKELRQSNRFLAELADVEWTEQPVVTESPEPMSESCPVHHTSQDESLSTGNEFKLYVGNIDYAATEAELAACFAPYGNVESSNIPVNRYTGRARGFGFVSFASRSDAEKAMAALNGTTFKGRQIQVNFAKERDLSA